ncbi:MAG: hypothetical protein F6K24_26525 [Okeania sp. SIO2D1]|nr:hypothetical protein [Okeania sp. SIO2D1]
MFRNPILHYGYINILEEVLNQLKPLGYILGLSSFFGLTQAAFSFEYPSHTNFYLLPVLILN